MPVGQCPVYMSVHHANRRHSCIYISSDIEVGGVLHSNGVVSCGALVRVLGTITNASDLQGPQGFVWYLPSPVHTFMSCAKRYRDLSSGGHDGCSNRAASRDGHVKTKVHDSNVVNASRTNGLTRI